MRCYRILSGVGRAQRDQPDARNLHRAWVLFGLVGLLGAEHSAVDGAFDRGPSLFLSGIRRTTRHP